MAHKEPWIALRPATPEDCGLIVDLIFELATYERQPEDCHATPERLRAQLFDRSPSAAECIIGELRGEPVGFAIFCHNFSTWECAPGLYLEDLFVRPAHRRAGLGGALLARIAEIALERGCARLEWSVLDWNQPALDFYKAHEAKAMDAWTTHRLEGQALTQLARMHPHKPDGDLP